MNLDEIIKSFEGIPKGPTRTYNMEKCGVVTLYSMPNGICIYNKSTDADSKASQTASHIDGGCHLGSNYQVIEEDGEYVVLKRLRTGAKSIPSDTADSTID